MGHNRAGDIRRKRARRRQREERRLALRPGTKDMNMTSDNLLSYLKHLTGPVCGFELDAYLRDANRHLVGFVTESKSGAVESRLFGDAPDEFLTFLNQPLLRVPGPAAGYRVAFREKLA